MTASLVPYDHEALWFKSKVFLNRAMDDGELRSFDERALWASLALELLGKAALARVSPLLIAEPTEDGTNLLVASGLIEGEVHNLSVRAKTIFVRCAKAFKPFNHVEAGKIVAGRNEYLHSGGIGFLGIPEHVWWPKFWAQAVILVNALDKDVEDLVGPTRLGIVNAHLAQNKKNEEHRLQMLIERAQQRVKQRDSGLLPAKVLRAWERESDMTVGLGHRSDATCPACGELAVLEGEFEAERHSHWDQIGEDEYEGWIEIHVVADYLTCSNCRLVLDTTELIEAAGIDSSFTDTDVDSDSLYMEAEFGHQDRRDCLATSPELPKWSSVSVSF